MRTSPLFAGMEEEEIRAILGCLDARVERYPKGAYLLRVGDTVESVGLLLDVYKRQIQSRSKLTSSAKSLPSRAMKEPTASAEKRAPLVTSKVTMASGQWTMGAATKVTV